MSKNENELRNPTCLGKKGPLPKAFEVGICSVFKSQLSRPVWLKQSSIQLTRRGGAQQI